MEQKTKSTKSSILKSFYHPKSGSRFEVFNEMYKNETTKDENKDNTEQNDIKK